MKPRNREINIFNMSLLDVLCGALGAFCFLMLVLFPFYSQDKGSAKAPDVPAGVDPKNFEEAQARVKQLEDILKKFQGYAAQAEAQQKRAEAQNRQLQSDLKTAQDRNDQLEMRKPLLTVGRFNASDGDYVQLYVEDDRKTDKGAKSERVDPTKSQSSIFGGDFGVSGEGAGLAYVLVRDTPQGEYRVFLKIIKHKTSDPPIRGYVTVEVEGQPLQVSPSLYAAQEHTAIPIAIVTSDQDRKLAVRMVVPKEATTPPADTGKQ
jgi:Skp family chaperone for outer membrane proteins